MRYLQDIRYNTDAPERKRSEGIQFGNLLWYVLVNNPLGQY